MATVRFTAHLRSKLPQTEFSVTGGSVRDVLQQVFDRAPGLASYVLDDQGRVRHHVAIFVDGEAVVDREGLSDALSPEGEVYVMQALSGG